MFFRHSILGATPAGRREQRIAGGRRCPDDVWMSRAASLAQLCGVSVRRGLFRMTLPHFENGCAYNTAAVLEWPRVSNGGAEQHPLAWLLLSLHCAACLPAAGANGFACAVLSRPSQV